jgi:lipopolysaccharide/colanic/teichoic acid biosynthesis glycosyltransferase
MVAVLALVSRSFGTKSLLHSRAGSFQRGTRDRIEGGRNSVEPGSVISFSPTASVSATVIPAASGLRGRLSLATKRVADLLLAVFILPFIVMFGIPVAIIVMLDGGKPIFGHKRIGKDGRTFACLKFRSMYSDADQRLKVILDSDPAARVEWAQTFKLKNDPRVTRIGRILRKTSLDELPQVWNIIRGEMSFVGPRPIVAKELDYYGDQVGYYLSCKPGITGLWQIGGRSDTDYGTRVELDTRYATTRSFAMDMRIMVMTVPAVLASKGAY